MATKTQIRRAMIDMQRHGCVLEQAVRMKHKKPEEMTDAEYERSLRFIPYSTITKKGTLKVSL